MGNEKLKGYMITAIGVDDTKTYGISAGFTDEQIEEMYRMFDKIGSWANENQAKEEQVCEENQQSK